MRNGKDTLIEKIKRRVRVYDVGVEAGLIDRFTVVVDGSSVYGMNERPDHPQAGFSQYVGEAWEIDFSRVGKRIPLNEIPYQTLIAIRDRL